MKYRRVGKSGLKISDVSLGSWLTYGGSVENQVAKACMSTALEQGINFIDSSGFGVFLSALKAANNNYGQFKICNVDEDVMELFKI